MGTEMGELVVATGGQVTSSQDPLIARMPRGTPLTASIPGLRIETWGTQMMGLVRIETWATLR